MKVKDVLNRLFKNSNNGVYGIANFGDLIEAPKKDDFGEDETIDCIIDEYKKIFYDIINQNRTLTSNSLHLDDFQKKLEMNIDLLMHICFEEEWDLLSFGEKSFNVSVAYAKLKMYLNDIIELENNIKYIFVALEQLKKEKSKSINLKQVIGKRRMISDEQNNLLGILCVIKNQRYAIYHKINACSIEFKAYMEKSLDDKEKYAVEKYHRLLDYANDLISPEQMTIINSFSDIVNKVAALEKTLEVYAYNNKEGISNIRSELGTLSSELDNYRKDGLTGKIDEEIIKSIEKRIIELEKKTRVFYEFGRNIVKEEDLEDLYRDKFKYYTLGLHEKSSSPFLKSRDEGYDFIEYSYYERFISDYLEGFLTNEKNIINGNFENVNKEFWDAIKMLFHYGDEKVFDINYILTNKLVLSFLIDTYYGDLYSFFHNQFTNTPSYIKSLNNRYFGVEDVIPLSTFFTINSVIEKNEKVHMYAVNSIHKALNIIFERTKEEFRLGDSKGYYHIPEGITRLSMPSIKDFSSVGSFQERLTYDTKCQPIIEAIVKKADKKYVYLPSSLEKLTIQVFQNSELVSLIINDGLQEVDDYYAFDSNVNVDRHTINIRTLDIPSSLKSFPWECLDYNYLYNVSFDDFRNSRMLNNPELLRRFIVDNILFLNNKIQMGVSVIWLDKYVPRISLREICKKINQMKPGLEKSVLRVARECNYRKRILSRYDQFNFYVDRIINEFSKQVFAITGFRLGSKPVIKEYKEHDYENRLGSIIIPPKLVRKKNRGDKNESK